METFFLTKEESARCGWAERRMEKQRLRKMRARGAAAL